MSGLKDDFHGIEAMADVVAAQEFQITAGGMAKGVLFVGADAFHGTPKIVAAAGAYLDKNQQFPMTANQVDFSARGAVVAIKDAIPMAAQKSGGNPLTVGTRLRRRRQPGRRRAIAPV